MHPVYAPETSRSDRRIYWEKLLSEYKSSGLKRSEFAAKHGLKPKDLARWCYRSKIHSVKKAVPRKVQFLPVTLSEDKPAELPSKIELIHSSGFRLVAAKDSDEALLKRVMLLLLEICKC